MALSMRAMAHLNKEPSDSDRAIADAEAAIMIAVMNLHAYRASGLAYVQKEQWDKAIADVDTAIRLNPDDGSNYYDRGMSYFVQGKLEEAKRDLNNVPIRLRQVARLLVADR